MPAALVLVLATMPFWYVENSKVRGYLWTCGFTFDEAGIEFFSFATGREYKND